MNSQSYKIVDPFYVIHDTPYYEYIHRIKNSDYYASSMQYVGLIKHMHLYMKVDTILKCSMVIRAAALLKEMSDDNLINTYMSMFGTHTSMSCVDLNNAKDCHGNSILHYAASFGVGEGSLDGVLDICNEWLIQEKIIDKPIHHKYIINNNNLSPIDIISNRGGLYPQKDMG